MDRLHLELICCASMKHTLASKRRLSLMRCGANNPFYGRKHTPKTRAKLAAILRRYAKNRTYEINPLSIKVPRGNMLSYLAGIVDGEGYFGWPRRRPALMIYNTEDVLMRWLRRNIGGKVGGHDKRGRKICRCWSLSAARDVYVLSVALLPLLLIKRTEALRVIKFLKKKYGERLSNSVVHP